MFSSSSSIISVLSIHCTTHPTVASVGPYSFQTLNGAPCLLSISFFNSAYVTSSPPIMYVSMGRGIDADARILSSCSGENFATVSEVDLAMSSYESANGLNISMVDPFSRGGIILVTVKSKVRGENKGILDSGFRQYADAAHVQ
ncbi:hypothetical protein DPMN_087945 [Dreissena polymorpha]|uniref:Uncharacterized protein n=1 Tax=Dreissena polymorpha TaxID=45954 RepID=A0A9D4KT92_DREPO|nr:hypothetical protein DPMN_087945 [Dreissena polymorpha]